MNILSFLPNSKNSHRLHRRILTADEIAIIKSFQKNLRGEEEQKALKELFYKIIQEDKEAFIICKVSEIIVLSEK